MIRSSFLVAVSALALVACASTDNAEKPVDKSSAVETSKPVSAFDLAMSTSADLVVANNTQAAIGRLTQLIGEPTLTPDERAEVLFELGRLSMSEAGYDSEGAVRYFEEIVDDYADSDWATTAQTELDVARGKVTSLVGVVENVDSTRQQKFDALMQLGRHQDAMDIMQSANLTPDNGTLLAMYQIGYLCEGSDLTGRAYDVTDIDGTARSLRFCDLGK